MLQLLQIVKLPDSQRRCRPRLRLPGKQFTFNQSFTNTRPTGGVEAEEFTQVTVQRSFMAKKGQVTHNWFIVDATDQVLGRLSTQIAMVLMGKHRPDYTPHVDTGDYVVVINAEKVVMTGRKMAI